MRASVLTTLLIVFGVPAAAAAHDPGLSALEVRVARTHVTLELMLAAKDAEDAARHPAAAGVGLLAKRALAVLVDGRALQAQIDRPIHDETGGVRVRLTYEQFAGDRLIVRSTIPLLLARGHRQLVSIRDSGGTVVAERMLGADAGEIEVDLRALGAAGPAAGSYFRLGLAHILGGYDHLLFLAGLLVVARRVADAVKTITAFTIAHSLTLVLTTIGWVEVPSVVVEPLIAASIMYVAAENLVCAEVTGRWRLTFAFGLVHGFGFAGALRELGLGEHGESIAVPLAAFNLGVEAGQVLLALLLLPVVARVRAYPAVGGRFATAGSVVVLLAGTYWLIERAAALG